METRSKMLQEQSQQLSLRQETIQAITILQYTSYEIVNFLETIATENPLIELEVNTQELLGPIVERELSLNLPDESTETLLQYLSIQLAFHSLTKTERKLIDYYILNLDEKGYINLNEAEVAKLFNVKHEDVRSALKILRNLDPPGIGARNLQECLLLQLKRIPQLENIYIDIIEQHFHEFVSKRWNILINRFNLPLNKIQQLADLLKTLNPRPGLAWSKENSKFIIPDFYIDYENGKWSISLREDQLYKLTLNHDYMALLQQRAESDTQQYLVKMKQQYDWLEKSLMQRRVSIIALIQEILIIQGDYFTSKTDYLQPMTMKEVAERIGVHESTVSRIIKNKYVSTPKGNIFFKNLFTGKTQLNGDTISNDVVKSEIERIVLSEDKSKPFSDQAIADILTKMGFKVARRTVSKYRDQLNIPSAILRKRFE